MITTAPATLSPKIAAMLKIDRFSTDYRIQLDPTEAREFVSRADSYNNFSASDLNSLIDSINAHLPPMDFGICNGQPNPNNGRSHHFFQIGNEGSRVIYLHVIHAYMPKGYDYQSLAATLESMGESARADEAEQVDTDNAHRFTFRFWWD